MPDSIIVNSVGLTPEKILGWFFEEISLFIPFITELLISIIILFLTKQVFRFLFITLGFGKQKSKKAAKNLFALIDLIPNMCNIDCKH